MMSMDKKALRGQIREKKRAMSSEEIQTASEKLGEMLFATELFQEADTIYGYLPYNQEVRTTFMLEYALRQGKKVAVPKIFGDEMRFIYLDDLSKVEKGYSGIPEPVADGPEARDEKALVLVPGLAFDGKGNRMGYGGGFYDKFFAREPEHPTIALCYAFQMLPEIPAGEYDVPVDQVLWA